MAALQISAKQLMAAETCFVALERLYEETADYIRINHLGDVHHNKSMRDARDAIEKYKQEFKPI